MKDLKLEKAISELRESVGRLREQKEGKAKEFLDRIEGLYDHYEKLAEGMDGILYDIHKLSPREQVDEVAKAYSIVKIGLQAFQSAWERIESEIANLKRKGVKRD